MNSPVEDSVFERWRPALIAFAILATVIAFGVVTSESNNENSDDISNPNVVVETSLLPLVTVPLDRTLESGMQGDDVLRLQQRLKDLRFDPGPVDGMFGQNTVQAMWAFEKLVLGVPRERATGTVTQSTWSIMQSDLKFKPRRKADSPTHVEVYLQEQVLIVFTNQEPVLVTHISSGTGEKWCEEVKIDPGEEGNKTTEQIKQGICGQAVTPPGIFIFTTVEPVCVKRNLARYITLCISTTTLLCTGRFLCRSSRHRMAVYEFRCRLQDIFQRL